MGLRRQIAVYSSVPGSAALLRDNEAQIFAKQVLNAGPLRLGSSAQKEDGRHAPAYRSMLHLRRGAAVLAILKAGEANTPAGV